MRLVLVSDWQHKKHPVQLVRVLRGHGVDAELWEPADFVNRKGEIGTGTRLLFVGDHHISEYIRKMVRPSYEEYGIRWGCHRRMAVLYTVDEMVNKKRAFEEMERELQEVRASPQATISEIDYRTGMKGITGKLIAGQLLNETSGSGSGLRAGKWEMRYRDQQILLGLCTFLIDTFDDWTSVSASTAASVPRQHTPIADPMGATPSGLVSYGTPRIGNPEAPMVSYSPPAVHNPTGTPVPTRTRTLSHTPTGAGIRTKTAQDLRDEIGILKTQNDQLRKAMNNMRRELRSVRSAKAILEQTIENLRAELAEDGPTADRKEAPLYEADR